MAQLDPSRLLNLSIEVITVVIAIAIIANFITAAGFMSGSAAVKASTESNTTINSAISEIPSSVTVRATTEKALAFDGNQSVDSSAPVNATNGSWTLCSTVELNSSANLNATYDVLAYDNETALLQYDAGQWRIYYDNGTADGTATIDAPDPTNGLRAVCGRYNATANRLYVVRDGAFSAPGSLTTSTTSRNVSWEWYGRQDEVRVFGNDVSNTTLIEYAEDPVRPQPTEDRLARFMFDEGEGSTTTVYFANATADVSGLTWTDGVGNPRKWLGLASAIEEGDDYVLIGDPFSIRLVDGGYLDGAPIVYVSWTSGSIVGLLVGFLPVMLGFLVVVVLANEVIGALE